MAPPHTMSPSKRLHSGPPPKSTASRSLTKARLSRDSYIQSSLPRMPHGVVDEAEIINQFRLHRDRESESRPSFSVDVDENETRKRISYTREQKLAAISYATTTYKARKDGSLKVISKYAAAQNLGITTKMLRDWINKQQDIKALFVGTRKHRIHSDCQEPEMEDQLLEMFKTARKAGRKINKPWFIHQAQRIYGTIHSHRISKASGRLTEYSGFKFSVGWFQGFKKRAGISSRCPTKKSQQVPENFRQKIVSWFQFNRRNSQSLPRQIPQHGGGRYRLCDIGNMDQTPIAYEFLDGHCYDFKGAKTVWIKTHRSGWDKRQATLMIYVSADGVSRCKPLLIFKGNDGVKNSRMRKEINQYDPGVVVQWNQKAYCNSTVMIKWLKQQYKFATVGFSTTITPRLLSLDVFAGQKTAEVKQAFRDLNITTSFIPAGCTGYVQVLDVAINKPLKNRTSQLADLHYDEHFEKWSKGSYTVGDRRILLTKWVGQAWREFHVQQAPLISSTFRKLGLSLAVDGSEDAEILVKDVPGLEVGDWRLSPDQDDVQEVEEIIGGTTVKTNEDFDNGEREYVMQDEVDGVNEVDGYEGEMEDEIEQNSDCEME